jgi:hypothetical protein
VDVIQELADTYDVEDIMILHDDDGSPTSHFMGYRMFNFDSSLAPKLLIIYTSKFPVVVTRTNSIHDTNATSHTVDLPASISADDLLIVLFSVDGAPSITWPGGWTEFKKKSNGTDVTFALAYRQADGGEGATITVTTGSSEKSAHASYRITGHEDPATQAPEASTGATAFSTLPDPDSLSPAGGDDYYLWLHTHGHDGPRTTTGTPAEYRDKNDNQGVSADSVGVAGFEQWRKASSENPLPAIINVDDQWVAITVAISPPGAAPAFVPRVMQY